MQQEDFRRGERSGKDRMRIALIGQAAFGAKVLETLIGAGHTVVVTYTSKDATQGKPVLDSAQNLGVPAFTLEKRQELANDLRRYAPDLCVMAFVTEKIPLDALRCPTLGTIEYHPSLLPRHRGSSSLNWTIINGEALTGVTIFWVDEGMDTGPILLQKEVDVSPEDTVGSLYFNKLFPLGVEALVEALRLIQDGKAPRIPQDESLATYEPPIQEKHALVDWSQPVRKVYDLIRGTNPHPGATTFWQGKKLKIYDAGMLSETSTAFPGEVIEVNEEGFVVSALGGAIVVKRVQPQGSNKMSASDFLKLSGFTRGARLGK